MNKMYYIPGLTKRTRFIVFAATAALGLILVVCGVVKTASVKKFKAACTARCEGVIPYVYERTDWDGKDSYCFHVLYTADSGQRYEFRTNYRAEKREEGDTIAVFYDPSDPGKCYTELYYDSSGKFLCLGGGVLILYGVMFGLGFIKPRNS